MGLVDKMIKFSRKENNVHIQFNLKIKETIFILISNKRKLKKKTLSTPCTQIVYTNTMTLKQKEQVSIERRKKRYHPIIQLT